MMLEDPFLLLVPYCQGRGTVYQTLLRYTLKMNLSCIFKGISLTYIFLGVPTWFVALLQRDLLTKVEPA